MNNPSLHIEQFVDEGLGNSAYLVGSHETKLAVMIDPLRDVDRYLAVADRLGMKIVHVLDTHLHADFVSGAREIAAQTGAMIGASLESHLGFDHQPLVEGDELPMGGFTVEVMTTPGHTPEHISFQVVGTDDKTPAALFSGGALIVGGAARTDLLGHELTVPLARNLYHTIHDKLLALPDTVTVYPTHGAGSFCVAPMSAERVTTIGRERRFNPLAQAQTEEEFIERALSGLPSYPVYYQHLRAFNRSGPRVYGGLPALKPLSAQEVHDHLERGAVLLDVRSPKAFGKGHIPGAYNIRVDAPLTTWAGWLIPFGSQLVLVAKNAEERLNATRQLLRIGYDNLLGYLDGGVEAWAAAGLRLESVPTISMKELRERMHDDEMAVLDVRQLSEWQAGHIPGAIHIENGRLPYDDLPLPTDKPIAVHCAHGNRSMAGVAVLKRRGYHNAVQVEGGFSEWEKAGFEVVRG
jgi:hydroxyacylglutathione hydrolase